MNRIVLIVIVLSFTLASLSSCVSRELKNPVAIASPTPTVTPVP